MPKAARPDAYPTIYYEIAEAVGERQSIWRVPAVGPMPDEPNAKGEVIPGFNRLLRLQQHFYAFKSALRRHKDSPEWERFWRATAKIAIYIDRESCSLTFRHQDDTWQARAIASGAPIDKLTGKPILSDGPSPITPDPSLIPSPITESLARVIANLKESK